MSHLPEANGFVILLQDSSEHIIMYQLLLICHLWIIEKSGNFTFPCGLYEIADLVLRLYFITRVYRDLEVAFVISEEETICEALAKSVELLQGHTALISQYYYGCLFNELLFFQLPDRYPPAQREPENEKCSETIGFSTSAISVLNNGEFSTREKDNSALIHMDVDQIFLPTPEPVKAAIFESFARQNMTKSECDVTPSLKKFIKNAYGFPTDNNSEFIYADCPLAICNKLVQCCIQEGGTLCLPICSNGNYFSSAKFLNANIVQIHTKFEDGFKLTENLLNNALETVTKPWVYITGPTINPTGLIYDNEEIENLLTVINMGPALLLILHFPGWSLTLTQKDGIWRVF